MNTTQKFTAFYTILRKEVVRFFRIWPQTLLPPVINQSLYFIIFGAFIGSRIGLINGVPYMDFIVPGLVMMAVINSSFANVVSSFFGSKFQRNIEELMVSPTPDWVVLAGYCGGGVLRGVLVGLIIFVISSFFTGLHIYNFGLILLFIVLTAVTFSLGGFINAIFAKRFDDISIFPMFVLTPLTYFGGVFYSINSLPPIWQNLSKLNPILYMVDGFRYGFFGQSDLNVTFSAIMLIVLTIVMTGISLYLLRKGTGMRS